MDQPDDRPLQHFGSFARKIREGFHPGRPSTRRALATVARLLVILTLAPLAHHFSARQALSTWQSDHPPEPELWEWAIASRGYRSELALAPEPPAKPTPRPRRRRRPAHRSLRPTSEAASPARGARSGPGGPSASSRGGGGGSELRLPLEAPDRVWWLAQPPRLLVPGPAGPKLYLGPARDARQASEARKASVSGGPQNQRGPLAAGPTEANRPGGQWQDLGRGWGALAQFLRVTPALASGQEQARGAGGGDRQSGGERGGSAAEQARAPGSPLPGPGSEGARERQRYRDSRRLSFDFAAFPN